MKFTCFKAYDIHGKLGTELNAEIAYKIGRAYGQIYQPKTIVVGCDVRLTSESLKQVTIKGLNDVGVNVRASNTEPLLRLNIESRSAQNPKPMEEYAQALTEIIQ